MADGKMLEGKVAVVTGAGRGIGRGFAMLMASQGAKVVVNDIGGSVEGEGQDSGPAYEVVNEIRGAGGEAVMNADSVTDWDGAHRIVQQAVDEFGKIDIVVNNAGILRDRIFHRMTEEDWDGVINVHLKGSFNVSRAAADHFRAQESGCFVHMTSTSGLIGNFGQANYSAAKLGIAGLSKSIALDMSRFNVRSNCITPFAWSRMIGSIPQNTEAERERVAKIKEMTPGKDRPDGGIPGQRCGIGCHRADLRRAQQRNLPDGSVTADPFRASRRGLDARTDRRTRLSGDEAAFLRARPVRRRVQLGSHLEKKTRYERHGHGGQPQSGIQLLQAQRGQHYLAGRVGRGGRFASRQNGPAPGAGEAGPDRAELAAGSSDPCRVVR